LTVIGRRNVQNDDPSPVFVLAYFSMPAWVHYLWPGVLIVALTGSITAHRKTARIIALHIDPE
jgi:hypothetical protein